MKSLLIVFAILCFPVRSDVIDELFQKHQNVELVLKEIGPNGKRPVDQLIALKGRALRYYASAKAYALILQDGLVSEHQSYKRETCNLLLNTFEKYLLSDPPPAISDVAKLIKPNATLTTNELIFLRRAALSVFSSPDDYYEIMHDGLNATHDGYKGATSRLLLETFHAYLSNDPRPILSQALILVKANGRITVDEHMKLKRLLFVRYPESENVIRILQEGLITKHEEYRAETIKLAHETIDDRLARLAIDPNLLTCIVEISKMGVRISLSDKRVHIMSALTALNEKGSLENALPLIFSNAPHNAQASFLLIDVLLELRPDLRDRVASECKKLPRSRFRDLCLTLHGKIDRKQSPSEIYRKLALLRGNGYSNTDIFNQYQNLLERGVTSRLNDEINSYFGGETSISTVEQAEFAELLPPKSCPVCMEDHPPEHMYGLERCHHPICKDCLSNYISTQLSEFASSIFCMDPKCRIPLSKRDFEVAGHEDAESTLKKRALAEKVHNIPGAVFCINEHCPDAFIPFHKPEEPSVSNKESKKKEKWWHLRASSKKSRRDTADRDYECRTCQTVQCLDCRKTHVGLSCREFTKMEAKKHKAEASLLAGKNKTYKPCPKCGVMIEKDLGCDHMTCKACEHQFWWKSLKDYK